MASHPFLPTPPVCCPHIELASVSGGTDDPCKLVSWIGGLASQTVEGFKHVITLPTKLSQTIGSPSIPNFFVYAGPANMTVPIGVSPSYWLYDVGALGVPQSLLPNATHSTPEPRPAKGSNGPPLGPIVESFVSNSRV
ncbi:uncharacterized protein TRAVEDRAFT_48550 [Trametes versicolor FP-101664 SS1]|uniref:uncharacterized protein n=1 Tax=Trametes versicolor (strain FP-101664) TaxID=717944 RepID=UPI0004622959|nr:uncharacterized protein TRAVEDRAFT_48550 [Trametes versicolor FP-101664 SS1]EIW57511.1 hypothetical protein TRAVEDRAFT_48550 [Trametes versicolor FP-101664 SS1]